MPVLMMRTATMTSPLRTKRRKYYAGLNLKSPAGRSGFLLSSLRGAKRRGNPEGRNLSKNWIASSLRSSQ
jgi:hypothetical protein